ncbi:MAG TPA: transglutaminaseTgpA domain-containing protein [Thermoanaerobaculia bacterium]|nr:transglutaminaseTgpA domain-containing protein [Thermoanaerobaculia bacterium]
MTRRARELEALLLAMFAAVPLYFTFAIGKAPLIAFHAAMAGIALRVAAGKGPELIPAPVMRWLAMAYVPFYFVDWIAISHSAIAASTHLVLFIAVYQPIESMQRNNQAQRLLTTSLIFVASLATSTHITIVFFVIAFAFLMLRQLMYVSHMESVQSVDRTYAEPPSGRAALFYVAAATLLGALLFPFLPRVRNPFVQGITQSLPGATSGLSESIDFREPRVASADTTIVARVWMDAQTRTLFTPLRLRGNLYDRFDEGEWKQTLRGLRPVMPEDRTYVVARPNGVRRNAVLQHRPEKGKLYFPVGTYAVTGPTNLFEGGARETYYTYDRGLLNMEVEMAYAAEPLRLRRLTATNYPVTPEVAALARRIVGNETRPERQAAAIENWMLRNFRYVPNPATAKAMSIEQFLLRERAGHCEYFAAGMVVLLTALDVPARIAGGFYGGRFNPLSGNFTVRRTDAHAWTEVWDGTKWRTFDSTPPSLRPGAAAPTFLRAYVTALADSITYFWDRYILTFGLADQIALFSDFFTWGRERIAGMRRDFLGGLRASVPALLAILAVAAVAAFAISRRRRPLFDLLAARLAAHGIEVAPSTTVEEALRELRARDPQFAAELAPLAAMYEEEEFSGRSDAARRRLLRRRLAELKA